MTRRELGCGLSRSAFWLTSGVTLLCCATLAVAAGAISAPVALAALAPQPPSTDPFYAPPSSLASLSPGAIIRSRSVNVDIAGVPLSAQGDRSYQLLYRTTDATGRPAVTATTVIVPGGARPASGRQLISVQDAENSDSSTCAPSYQLQVGETNSFASTELASVEPELLAGRDLVMPDALGPDSEFFVTRAEGAATLDSIRAVEQFAPAELDGARTPVGLIGYSEGAHQTVAADELAPQYAPMLDLVGVAAGGVPVGDVETLSYLAEGDPANVLQIMTGIDRAYPQLDWPALLNAAGQAASQQVSTCSIAEVLAGPDEPLSTWTTVPNVFAVPRVAKVLAANALGHDIPTAPTYLFIGAHDEEVSQDALDKLVAHDCQGGARIDYDVQPGGTEHFQSAAVFEPLGMAYLNARFSGAAGPDTCVASAPGRGTARLIGRRLPIRHREALIVFRCGGAAGAACRGTVSIVVHRRGRPTKRVSALVCGRARLRAMVPATHTLKLRLDRQCLRLVRLARGHRLTGRLIAHFTTNQPALMTRVSLVGGYVRARASRPVSSADRSHSRRA